MPPSTRVQSWTGMACLSERAAVTRPTAPAWSLPPHSRRVHSTRTARRYGRGVMRRAVAWPACIFRRTGFRLLGWHGGLSFLARVSAPLLRDELTTTHGHVR